MRALFLFGALTLAGCGASDDENDTTGSGNAANDTVDTSAGADTSANDSGTDSGGGGGGGGGSGGNVDSYEQWVVAHARFYCSSLETCGYLDDQTFETRQACMEAITTRLGGASCPDYDPAAGERCVLQDRNMAAACEQYPEGRPPEVCRNVCDGPRDTAAAP
jgi:hypothetical protein